MSSKMGLESVARARTNQPCAAYRMLRRRCDSNCILAPYFPCDEIDKFAKVHKVFGASNVIKMVQMVEETSREDAVKALVYEATARIRDPVYGSTGAIFQLQKMVQELRMQLESTKARISDLEQQKDLFLNHLDLLSPVINGGNFSLDSNDSIGYDSAMCHVEGEWML